MVALSRFTEIYAPRAMPRWEFDIEFKLSESCTGDQRVSLKLNESCKGDLRVSLELDKEYNKGMGMFHG